MNPALSVRECFKAGWRSFAARPWFFVGVTLLVAALQSAIGLLQENLGGVLGFALSLFLSTLLCVGILTLFLKAHEDPASAALSDLWNPGPFWRYLGLSILLALIVGLGLILLIIPGILFALMFFAAAYLVVDRGQNPIDALKESVRLTRGSRVKLFLLFLASAVISLIAALPFLLGLLVVAPVVAMAGVHAYRTLAHAAAEIVPTS